VESKQLVEEQRREQWVDHKEDVRGAGSRLPQGVYAIESVSQGLRMK
jgi:hypothetical protein